MRWVPAKDGIELGTVVLTKYDIDGDDAGFLTQREVGTVGLKP